MIFCCFCPAFEAKYGMIMVFECQLRNMNKSEKLQLGSRKTCVISMLPAKSKVKWRTNWTNMS